MIFNSNKKFSTSNKKFPCWLLIILIISIIYLYSIDFNWVMVNYFLYDLHLTYYLSSIYLFLFRNLYWIKFIILWWIVIFIMFYILFLFKYLFLFEAKIKYQPKVLPKFILDRFTDLNNKSTKPELQNILIKIYFRIVLFYLLVGFLYTLLLIYS